MRVILSTIGRLSGNLLWNLFYAAWVLAGVGMALYATPEIRQLVSGIVEGGVAREIAPYGIAAVLSLLNGVTAHLTWRAGPKCWASAREADKERRTIFLESGRNRHLLGELARLEHNGSELESALASREEALSDLGNRLDERCLSISRKNAEIRDLTSKVKEMQTTVAFAEKIVQDESYGIGAGTPGQNPNND